MRAGLLVHWAGKHQYFKGAAGSLSCASLCKTLKVACFPVGNGSGPNGSCACKRAQTCCEWQVRGAGRVVDLAADQDSTDLQKCLVCASRMIAADPARFSDARILALGAYITFIKLNGMELVNCSVNTTMHTMCVWCSLCKWVSAVWFLAGDSQGVGVRGATCQVLVAVLSVPGSHDGPL